MASLPAERRKFTGIGTLSILFGLLVFGGLVLPFVEAGGESVAMWDGGQASWTFSVVAILSVLGGMASHAGHRVGFAVAGGMAIAFAGFATMAIRLIWLLIDLGNELGGGSSLQAGAACWALAGVVGVFLFLGALEGVSPAWGEANPLAVVVGLLGAGTFTWGLVQPPFDGVAVWDHLFGSEDAWSNVSIGMIVGAVPVCALAVLLIRSRASLMLLGGCAGFWVTVWFSQSQDFSTGGQSFVQFMNGQFAAMTAGLGMMLVAALYGGMVPESVPQPGRPSDAGFVREEDTGPYRMVQIFGTGLIGLMLMVGLASHDEDVTDPFDSYDSYDSGSSDVDFGDLPYDSTWTPMAQACESGNMDACNELYWATPVGNDFETFGATCGGRRPRNGGGC